MINRFETSVCALHGVNDKRLCQLGHSIRAPKEMVAVCDIQVSAVDSAGLTCQASPEAAINYPEHAVIVNWKLGNAEKDKDQRLSAMQDLAAAVISIRRSPDKVNLV